MGSIHPVAAAGFGSDAERYEAGRPGYPPKAIDWLAEHLGICEGTRVADIGAGTGKLTRQLIGFGADVTAVEPVSSMARILQRLLPGVGVVAATAEDLPFGDASFDAITCGQSFHWFDTDAAWAEFRRVLRPGAGVGLIWNGRDRSVPWVDEVWSIMDEVEKRAPWRNHDHPELVAGEGFDPLKHTVFRHEVPVTRAIMLDRVASVSHVAVLPEPTRREVLARVAALVPDRGDVTMRYRVDVYATRAS